MVWINLLGTIFVIWMAHHNYRRYQAGRRQPLVGRIRGPGHFAFEIVGESHYQRTLERLAGGRTRDGVDVDATATLVLDSANPHDNMAVAVEIDGAVVGYMSKRNAREYRDEIARWGSPGGTFLCSAVIVGGWDRGRGDHGHFGVKLDLPMRS
jgi:hypothetical protein